ncbi:uracil-DNA glycosylase [Arthrobacter sp. zg-Y453]|uniref:Uracil-DNA glycosylase n=1 Tax=Arthrobacter caoxuetaonis TaxID=2886935 RepID=A0A9X1SDU0_9MICC|nr:uracil-DNA glycosylase [Arthrobacter caoxuetaonis]MCC3299548.1 uracil-DNA glycosylase [Arthrobacter caoxuetaonis]
MRNSEEPALFPLDPPATPGGGQQETDGGTPIPFTSGTPLASLMAPDWAEALAPAAGLIHRLGDDLERRRSAGAHILPAPQNILRAFRRPMSEVKVLIAGQDPYPTPGHAVGLSFSVEPGVRPLPRSLANIYKELQADLGIAPAAHGDLSAWTEQGVLLLNRSLTVEAGAANSHRGRGWEDITDLAVRALAARRRADGSPLPLVAVLWGRQAQALAPLLGGAPRVESAHPSPLSASRGFFGSRPFSRANEMLLAQGSTPVDWQLPGVP